MAKDIFVRIPLDETKTKHISFRAIEQEKFSKLKPIYLLIEHNKNHLGCFVDSRYLAKFFVASLKTNKLIRYHFLKECLGARDRHTLIEIIDNIINLLSEDIINILDKSEQKDIDDFKYNLLFLLANLKLSKGEFERINF
jgi:hypothetical protein